jgi:DAACS family dicarboxylate/amino acid:cation (Na+ or H+) symporter
MDGTALYECVVVIFIAQFYAVIDPSFTMTLTTQFTVILMALLTSVGVAGIPSASLVAISVILTVVGLPLEYIGIIFVVDRLLDMCRTAVNIYSDSVGAVVIASTEGETNFYK